MQTKENFWDFSVRVYSGDGVADSCLLLQDEHGADVNMLLFCCWAAITFGKLGDDDFRRALHFSQTWADNVVYPIRRVRRLLKRAQGPVEAIDTAARLRLRESIKEIELQSEKLQQQTLEGMLVGTTKQAPDLRPLETAAFNLRQYCESEEIELTSESVDRLATILLTAFPELAHKQMVELFR